MNEIGAEESQDRGRITMQEYYSVHREDGNCCSGGSSQAEFTCLTIRIGIFFSPHVSSVCELRLRFTPSLHRGNTRVILLCCRPLDVRSTTPYIVILPLSRDSSAPISFIHLPRGVSFLSFASWLFRCRPPDVRSSTPAS